MTESNPFRFFEILFVLPAIAYAIFSAWVAFLALQLWLGTWWAIPAIIALGLFLRGLGIPVVAVFGAIQVWAWPWWIAVPVFLPALPIMILLAPLAVVRREVFCSRQKSQNFRSMNVMTPDVARERLEAARFAAETAARIARERAEAERFERERQERIQRDREQAERFEKERKAQIECDRIQAERFRKG